ncbi:MAG: hypothetical protein JSV85_05085 [Candidatus Bathyarchaeota archaeon]|nr:MAG: hypothetical protein JSV85_05085 [Candidatus Bathyarchaeota archaeon]
MALEDMQKPRIPFVVELCSDKAAFEVKIRRKISFDMAELERLLRFAKGNDIMVDTPHILIFRNHGAEITLSKNGRMLIKKVRNEKEAMAVARKVLDIASESLL